MIYFYERGLLLYFYIHKRVSVGLTFPIESKAGSTQYSSSLSSARVVNQRPILSTFQRPILSTFSAR